MSFANCCPHCGSRPATKSDQALGMQISCPKCQDVFAVNQSHREEADGPNRMTVPKALIGGGPTFLLLLCGVGGCLLLSGCNKGASNSNSTEQVTAEANAKSESDQRRRAESLKNLKQIALAFHNYHDTYKTFPAAVQIGPKDVPHSWRITILQFRETKKVLCPQSPLAPHG